jgi:hypothetical protein
MSASEFVLDDTPAQGVGYAHLLEGLCVSLASSPRWDCTELNPKMTFMGDDACVETTVVTVRHASREPHVEALGQEIAARRYDDLADGSALWQERNELFDRLDFCDRVCGDLKSLRNGNPLLLAAIKKLHAFNLYCRKWDAGDFDCGDLPFKITIDSQVTLNMFADQRTFLCPDGTTQVFSYHARLTPSAWRMYFLPVPERRRILIGYIGSKPSSVTNHT